MLPPAPPLFSIMTCWPQISDSRAAAMRAAASAPPPGGKPTIMRTTRVGQAAACVDAMPGRAGVASAAAPKRRNSRRRSVMAIPRLVRDLGEARHGETVDGEPRSDGTGALFHLHEVAQLGARDLAGGLEIIDPAKVVVARFGIVLARLPDLDQQVDRLGAVRWVREPGDALIRRGKNPLCGRQIRAGPA